MENSVQSSEYQVALFSQANDLISHFDATPDCGRAMANTALEYPCAVKIELITLVCVQPFSHIIAYLLSNWTYSERMRLVTWQLCVAMVQW